MTKIELRAAKRCLGCTTAQLAERLGVSRWHLKKMLAKKDRQQVSAPVAAKVRELITDMSSLPIWRQCPYCGGDLLRQSKQPGGGLVVLHRCPAKEGVTIRISSGELGLTLKQAEAALGRRPGKNKDGGEK